MSLLDLVEQDDGERLLAHTPRQLALVATPGRPDQPLHRVGGRVFAHVEARTAGPGCQKRNVCQRLRQLGLADAGRPDEEERAERLLRIVQSRLRGPRRGRRRSQSPRVVRGHVTRSTPRRRGERSGTPSESTRAVARTARERRGQGRTVERLDAVLPLADCVLQQPHRLSGKAPVRLEARRQLDRRVDRVRCRSSATPRSAGRRRPS